ncbi:EamA-like transporter family protein [Scopulibacillus darangshiensis]|uniref:EamA-like transporter family protein n=1 Tax=Scopulibacillus darangshiensis TaxID=442528 RepID=A0A4R2NXU1_9BACL|nr:DMT family transporter [Scopulibacillus darangshiensis]TCP27049.1 EamA-like transporter family protein [Scopulibacillus darangshiensis]
MKKSLGADLSLVFVALIWGSTFVVVQHAISTVTPLTFNAWRFLLASLCLLIWKAVFVKNRKRIELRGILAGVLLGCFLFTGYIAQTVGLLYTSSSKAAFITGMSVVLVPIFSAVILKKLPAAKAMVGVLIAAAGLYYLTMSGPVAFNYGDGIVLFCAVMFALHIIFTAKVTHHYSSLSLTIIQLATVAVLSFVCGIVADGTGKLFDFSSLFRSDTLFSLLVTAVLATSVAFILQTVMQRFTSPTHVGLIFIMEPVFAAVTSAVWQHDYLTYGGIIGCLLILLGMVLSEWPVKKARKQPFTDHL